MCRFHVRPVLRSTTTLPSTKPNTTLESAAVTQRRDSPSSPQSSYEHSVNKGSAHLPPSDSPDPSSYLPRPSQTRRIALIVLKSLCVVCHFVLCATLAYACVLWFKRHGHHELFVIERGVEEVGEVMVNGSYRLAKPVLTKRGPDIHPNQFQTYTIIVACIFFFIVFFLWHMPILRDLISGLKLFVVATYELFHILVGMLVGGEVISICIDPNLGGETVIDRLLRVHPRMPHNPIEAMNRTWTQTYWSNKAVATLAAGYIGSSIVGFLFIFSAFDIVASKVASFVIGFGLLIPALRVDSAIAFLSIIGTEGIMIGLWFGDHGSALRFFVLFCGVMHLFYVVWDYTEERFFDKVNSSDCSQFTNLLGWPTSGEWQASQQRHSHSLTLLLPHRMGSLWMVYSSLVFTAAMFAGICVFKKTPAEMYSNANSSLPTR